MAGATVADQLDDNNVFVRKHGTQFMAIADFSVAPPEQDEFFVFDTTTTPGFRRALPIVLPAAYKNMGYITTDGIGESRSLSTSNTDMVQDIEPVRTDVDSNVRTLQVTFGEVNSWTKALASGLPVNEWPAVKSSSWGYADGRRTQFPDYRILIFTQDKVGDQAVYRIEYAYKATVTDMGDRTLNRSDIEGTQRTFTCFKDPEVGDSYWQQSEPALLKIAA